MKELEHRLNNLPNTYFAFVHAITTYANKKRERYDVRNVDGVNQRIYN